MKAAYVKCPYCEKRFNRNDVNIKVKQVSTKRYAHYDCWQNYMDSLTQEEKDQINFYNYVKTLFKENYNYILTKKLAEKYIKENNYTYSGMLKSLKWYYEKQNHSTEDANGTIGIIPYIYNQALQYYYKLYEATMINRNLDLMELQMPPRHIIIESPRRETKSLHLWLG